MDYFLFGVNMTLIIFTYFVINLYTESILKLNLQPIKKINIELLTQLNNLISKRSSGTNIFFLFIILLLNILLMTCYNKYTSLFFVLTFINIIVLCSDYLFVRRIKIIYDLFNNEKQYFVFFEDGQCIKKNITSKELYDILICNQYYEKNGCFYNIDYQFKKVKKIKTLKLFKKIINKEILFIIK